MTSDLQSISASQLRIFPTKSPKDLPAFDATLGFGTKFTDHMLEIDWQADCGWSDPVIKEYGPLSLSPAAPCLNYATQCFEGSKVYRGPDNEIRTFRFMENLKRFSRSIERLCFPKLSKSDLQELEAMVEKLIQLDARFLPNLPGITLYIRPCMIGTSENLAVCPSNSGKLYVLLSPVGPYYPRGFKPIKLLADTQLVRAWPGGCGAYKLGANYGPSILLSAEAAKYECDQVLWLFPENQKNWITEVGSMNIFMVRQVTGGVELVTPPLSDQILPGITRASLLDIAENRFQTATHDESLGPIQPIQVSERPYSMEDLIKDLENNELIEVFGAGTAAVITSVSGIHYKGHTWETPVGPSGMGLYGSLFLQTLVNIQKGVLPYKDYSKIIVESP